MMAVFGSSSPRVLLQTFANKRALVPILVALLWIYPATRSLVSGVLSDAFLQVSAFVAATLALYYGISHSFSVKGIQSWVSSKAYREILFASVMGVLPGCGGAIVVITQYTKGQIRFGAVVAVLTSTMGDAAFLLISQRPQDAVIVLSVCMLVGVLSGLFTNQFLPAPKLSFGDGEGKSEPDQTPSTDMSSVDVWISRINVAFWGILIIPMAIIALLLAMQYDMDQIPWLSADGVHSLGAMAGFVCLLLWALSARSDRYSELARENDNELPKHWMRKVAQDTQFVTSWVVVAFVVFELAMLLVGENDFMFSGPWQSGSILLAALIGLLPGCGPQILVTSFYLQNTIPMSALIANAVSNDGDALFPAIALAPKAAALATLYSFVPALIAGYGYYWIVEMS